MSSTQRKQAKPKPKPEPQVVRAVSFLCPVCCVPGGKTVLATLLHETLFTDDVEPALHCQRCGREFRVELVEVEGSGQ